MHAIFIVLAIQILLSLGLAGTFTYDQAWIPVGLLLVTCIALAVTGISGIRTRSPNIMYAYLGVTTFNLMWASVHLFMILNVIKVNSSSTAKMLIGKALNDRYNLKPTALKSNSNAALLSSSLRLAARDYIVIGPLFEDSHDFMQKPSRLKRRQDTQEQQAAPPESTLAIHGPANTSPAPTTPTAVTTKKPTKTSSALLIVYPLFYASYLWAMIAGIISVIVLPIPVSNFNGTPVKMTPQNQRHIKTTTLYKRWTGKGAKNRAPNAKALEAAYPLSSGARGSSKKTKNVKPHKDAGQNTSSSSSRSTSRSPRTQNGKPTWTKPPRNPKNVANLNAGQTRQQDRGRQQHARNTQYSPTDPQYNLHDPTSDYREDDLPFKEPIRYSVTELPPPPQSETEKEEQSGGGGFWNMVSNFHFWGNKPLEPENEKVEQMGRPSLYSIHQDQNVTAFNNNNNDGRRPTINTKLPMVHSRKESASSDSSNGRDVRDLTPVDRRATGVSSPTSARQTMFMGKNSGRRPSAKGRKSSVKDLTMKGRSMAMSTIMITCANCKMQFSIMDAGSHVCKSLPTIAVPPMPPSPTMTKDTLSDRSRSPRSDGRHSPYSDRSDSPTGAYIRDRVSIVHSPGSSGSNTRRGSRWTEHKRLVCVTSYQPRMDDELKIQRGDMITLEEAYNDGYGYGTNETTKMSGVFPLQTCEPLDV